MLLNKKGENFVTGTRSVRITQIDDGFQRLEVEFVVSDPGIRWVTVGCRYQVISGTGFFFAADAGEGPKQFADLNPSNGEWREGHLQVHVAPGTTTGGVSLVPATEGEVLIDEVWAVPGRFAVESTQYAERVELLESPLRILNRRGVRHDETQGPVDITNLPNILQPPLAGLAVAPRGVVGCLLRVRIETRHGLTLSPGGVHPEGSPLLENFHYAYVDIPEDPEDPGESADPAHRHRVYSHWFPPTE